MPPIASLTTWFMELAHAIRVRHWGERVAPRDVARPAQVSFFRLQLACIRNDVPHCSADTRRNSTGSLVVGEAGEIAYNPSCSQDPVRTSSPILLSSNACPS